MPSTSAVAMMRRQLSALGRNSQDEALIGNRMSCSGFSRADL